MNCLILIRNGHKLHTMRNSHKLLLASVMVLLASLKPDFAKFIPQIVKVGAAFLLLLIGLYLMWKERQW
ncbi:hypothetical protein [Dokdonia sp.]|uniref:hypothetical protein n=1 Tax=Dokdonia sp. TaxID=2024995 RepID=UPI003264C74D